MRRVAFLLTTFLLAACGSVRPKPANSENHPASSPAQAPSHQKTTAAPETIPAPAVVPAAPVAASTLLVSPQAVHTSIGSISATAILFDSRSHQLRVADQPGGPGSLWADAATAGKAHGGVAAVNAGFFTPEGGPLGLVISGGKKAGALNRSSLGAGFVIAGASPALVRRERGYGSVSDAVQAGPFLLEDGQSVPGLSTASSTARTFITTDGGTRWALVRTGPCSLQDLAAALKGADIGGMHPVTVLNLDGGRSSDLWISSAISGGPVNERPFWNKPVRNFLILVPRG